MDIRFVFSSTYSAWNKLGASYNTPWLEQSTDSSLGMRVLTPIANMTKKAALGAAFLVCTIATVLFSLFALPFRLYKNTTIENKSLQQDYNRAPNIMPTLEAGIRDYIDNKELMGKFKVAPGDKDEIIHHTKCYFARSREVYGPVAVAWVAYLLEKANREGKKLVFMARDGIAPYKMAIAMMQEKKYQNLYPNLAGDNKITLAYFSRALIKNADSSPENRALFNKYVENELKIVKDDKCILVDVGFTGSMIPPLRKLLPQAELSFDFLISHTDDADGFIYSENDPSLQKKGLKAVDKVRSIGYRAAGSNFATHWLEDSHQGVGKSATHLVEINGRVYPNTRVPGKKEYIVEPGSHDFIIRKWASKAIHYSWKAHNPEKIKKDDAVKKLDEVLSQIISTDLRLLIKHI